MSLIRRQFLTRAAVAGSVLGAPVIANAQSAKFNWKMTSAYGKGSPFYMDGPGSATDLAKRIREMSDGRLNIQVFGAGELIPAFEGFDAVRAGTVEMNHANAYFWTGKTAAAQYFTAVPFGMNFQGMNGWLYDGGGIDLWNEVYAPFGMVAMPCGNTGVQMTGWFKKEIKTVADLKGLKMRLGGGLFGETMAKLGVVAQNMPAGEVYQALEKGTLDATEFVGPADDERLGFNKVAPFYYYPGWWEGGAELEFFINKKAFDTLSPENKAIVRAAGAVAARDMTAKYDALNPVALKRLVGSGTKLKPFTKDVMDAGFKAAMEVFAAHEAKSPEFKKIHQDMRAFQRDQVLWSRFSEWRYDSFITTAKI